MRAHPLNPLHPTLLRTPGRYGLPRERVLPGNPDGYVVEPMSGGWILVEAVPEGVVYFGPGPAEVVRSPAPF